MGKLLAAVALLLPLLVSCGGDDDAGAPEKQITVLAASSLTDAFTELGGAFEEANGVQVVFTFAASAALVDRANGGAPADVIATDDQASYAKVTDASDPTVIGRNRDGVIPMGVLTDTTSFAEAQEWLEFVAGPDGQRIMAAHGFLTP